MHVTVRVPIDLTERVRARTVLLVSADADWRTAVERELSVAGYRVVVARHAGQALVESTRYGSVDLVVAEGAFGQGESNLPPRIFEDHPAARILLVPTRPATGEALLDRISAALK